MTCEGNFQKKCPLWGKNLEKKHEKVDFLGFIPFNALMQSKLGVYL